MIQSTKVNVIADSCKVRENLLGTTGVLRFTRNDDAYAGFEKCILF